MTASTENSSPRKPRHWPLPVAVVLIVLASGLYSTRIASRGADETRANTEQITTANRNADLTACRGKWGAASGEQLGAVLIANADRDKWTTEATRAAIEEGVQTPRYTAAVAELDRAQKDVDRSLAALGQRQREQSEAVELSLSDPVRFLKLCKTK
ncbi:hypothetical protein UFOVP1360_11 [uncultured Caudovirales phage]|uniref:Uncharacterized protein n=1 Tax=uncultured Caudovirales phage TaxID=2100421 RepID=A0A6J5RY98_9CAUD|nr:hypothetical protein UFOVP1360_11 [uncultured Caudovirales phage]